MKKQKILNLIMVLTILAIAIAGAAIAFCLKTDTAGDLGGQYSRLEIKDGTLIEPGQEGNVCTITIVCDTILSNKNKLNEEKAAFVPEDGIILSKTQVSFAEGNTVFDILDKVCQAADIQLEYAFTPVYGSYYIEGIGHLYEFDCGPESGWMYKVDNWFPNYGCSAYELKNGQDIVWCYTCTGLGADVGANAQND